MQGNAELISMLGEINPRQPYGTALFDALARLTVSVTVEAVCIRFWHEIGNEMEQHQLPEFQVYMTQRAPDDTAYPGKWHCPGSFIRPSEEISDVFKRLAECEFGGKILSHRFVTPVNILHETRGHTVSLVYLCTLDQQTSESLKKGKWFYFHQLPENTVDIHRWRIIPASIGTFITENTCIC